MVNLELAIFLGGILGVVAGILIFLLWRRLKNYGLGTWQQSRTIMISIGLFLTLVASSLLENYRAPIEIKVRYEMGSEMDPAIANLVDAGVKRMEIRRESSAGLGLFAYPVYKKQLIIGLITLLLLLVLNAEKVKSKLGHQLVLSANGKSKGSYKPLNIDSEEILRELEIKLREQKLFTDPSLNLDALSNEIGVSRYHLSQIINEQLDKNFYDLINGFRVQEAIRILKAPESQASNLLQLGYEVGFNSKASFYRAFKKATGTTPAAYRKSVKQC